MSENEIKNKREVWEMDMLTGRINVNGVSANVCNGITKAVGGGRRAPGTEIVQPFLHRG